MRFGFDNSGTVAKEIYQIGDWCMEQLRKAKNFVRYAGLSVFMLSSSVMYSYGVTEPNLNWESIVCIAEVGDLSHVNNMPAEIKTSIEPSLLMKSLNNHGYNDMTREEQSFFKEIEEKLVLLPNVIEANAVFGKNTRTLTLVMKFKNGLKLRVDRYCDKIDDENPYDRKNYFILSANGEELVDGALPIQELGERLEIFFKNV